MKASQFFARAFVDTEFRQAQLSDHRYYQKVEIGMMIFATVAGIAFTLYDGLRHGEWDAGLSLLGISLLSLATYTTTATTVAALEAIETKANPPVPNR